MYTKKRKLYAAPLIFVLVLSLLSFSFPAYAIGGSSGGAAGGSAGALPTSAITPHVGLSLPSLNTYNFLASLLVKLQNLFKGTPKPVTPDNPVTPVQQPLRIMPLGASVTYGLGSSAANYNAGYRGYLQDYLKQVGIKYDMVGSQRSGSILQCDIDNEGHVGYRIDQLANGVKNYLKGNPPDVVILHIGGNDVFQKYKLEDAPDRLNSLIDLIRENAPPGVKIVVFTLLDTSDSNYQPLVTEYNAGLRKVVASQAALHKDVWLAEMEGKIDVKTELYDKQHPNAKGYEKMAISCANAMAEFIPEMKYIKIPV